MSEKLQENLGICNKSCKMLPKSKDKQQTSFYATFEEQLNHRHPLYILANQINWKRFEDAFKGHYSKDQGAPAKPIRLMVSLLILKHLRNLSDENVVEQWAENAYYQYFSGEDVFAAQEPCVPTELVEFRKRIGESGIEMILQESIRVNGKDGQEKDATTDTTVQEKNITYPTDSKLHKKIIDHCKVIASKENIELRQSYTYTIKELIKLQRFRHHPKNHGKAKKADKKIKTIAGRLVRELQRKLPAINDYQTELNLYDRILLQKRIDKQKVYSIHEPHVQCISKGKEHKKYEFGSKVSITTTKNSGVIIGAINIPLNDYDAHTLEPAINQQQRLTGHVLKNDYVDRGYRGVKDVLGTNIIVADNKRNKTAYQKQKLRHGFRRRAAIEPRIGHLKSDHRLSRNFYKGIFGDNINVMLAAAAMNFKRMMNKWKKNPSFYFLIKRLFNYFLRNEYACSNLQLKSAF
jgi:transposase, IS5 family